MKKSDFISENEAAKFLNIDTTTLDKLRAEEKLPFIRINRFNRLYCLPDLFEWLKTRKAELGSETKNETG
jgi:hypothetical protein